MLLKVAEGKAEVMGKLRASSKEAPEKRKQLWKQLCLQWHPDKAATGRFSSDSDKAKMTEVFQHLQNQKTWFLT